MNSFFESITYSWSHNCTKFLNCKFMKFTIDQNPKTSTGPSIYLPNKNYYPIISCLGVSPFEFWLMNKTNSFRARADSAIEKSKKVLLFWLGEIFFFLISTFKNRFWLKRLKSFLTWQLSEDSNLATAKHSLGPWDCFHQAKTV